MTGAEFKVAREWLGLTTRWLADHFGVQERTVQRYDSGALPVPDWARERMEALAIDAASVVDEIVAAAGAAPLVTYRTDAEYRAHRPNVTYPASWHRAIVARAREVTGVPVEFWEPPPHR